MSIENSEIKIFPELKNWENSLNIYVKTFIQNNKIKDNRSDIVVLVDRARCV